MGAGVVGGGTFDLLGPKGKSTRLVYLTDIRSVGEGRFELGLRELVGTQGERMAPLPLTLETVPGALRVLTGADST